MFHMNKMNKDLYLQVFSVIHNESIQFPKLFLFPHLTKRQNPYLVFSDFWVGDLKLYVSKSILSFEHLADKSSFMKHMISPEFEQKDSSNSSLGFFHLKHWNFM